MFSLPFFISILDGMTVILLVASLKATETLPTSAAIILKADLVNKASVKRCSLVLEVQLKWQSLT